MQEAYRPTIRAEIWPTRGVIPIEKGYFSLNGKTEVVIKGDLFGQIPEFLLERDSPFLEASGKRYSPSNKLILVTDSNVEKLYGRTLKQNLTNAGFRVETFSFRPGELSKTRATALRLEAKLESLGFERDDVAIALGGGIVGDLTGYVASEFKRGMRLIQVPTTLLAQVDSCIGGKTGIDTKFGKNLIGTFYDPNLVFVDPQLLQSLPDRDYRTGLGEVVKYALLDAGILSILEGDLDKVLGRNPETLEEVISRSLNLKAHYVAIDPEDRHHRHILNFGHTIGQAIEAATDYQISHGEATAIGMVYEAKWAVLNDEWPQSELDLLISLLKKIGLPTSLPQGIDINKIVEATSHDKKITGGSIQFWVPRRLNPQSLPPYNGQVPRDYLEPFLMGALG